MGHSEHMQRYGSVDSFGQQCMKTQENLFRDVARAKDMVIVDTVFGHVPRIGRV